MFSTSFSINITYWIRKIKCHENEESFKGRISGFTKHGVNTRRQLKRKKYCYIKWFKTRNKEK